MLQEILVNEPGEKKDNENFNEILDYFDKPFINSPLKKRDFLLPLNENINNEMDSNISLKEMENIMKDWYKYDPNDNSIIALNDFPGVVAYGVNDNNAFYIDGYIYVTCSDKSFWAYNINENKWTPKTSTLFERGHSMGLSINGKGYYGTERKTEIGSAK